MTVFYDPLFAKALELYKKYLGTFPELQIDKAKTLLALRKAVRPYCTFKPDFAKLNPVTHITPIIYDEFDEVQLIEKVIKELKGNGEA